MGENVTRRDFMSMAGAAVGGLAIGAIGGYTLIPPKETIVEVPRDVEVEKPVPEWPWPYTRLDVEAVKERAYNAYFEAGCAYGAFEGIMGELRENVGFPFTSVPTKMMVFGKGGGLGWGTICGALNGALAAVNLVTSDYGKVGGEIIGEYTETAYPSWKPDETVKTDAVLQTSVSGSPLCHVSVTKWCEESGFASGSNERKERCGRLTGEVAGRAAEMLNALLDGGFVPVFQIPESTTTCNNCHYDDGVVANVHAKSGCVQCHGETH
jgi:hypothetical protein